MKVTDSLCSLLPNNTQQDHTRYSWKHSDNYHLQLGTPEINIFCSYVHSTMCSVKEDFFLGGQLLFKHF